MKYLVTKFRNLAIALKELGPFVKNGQHLRTGKPFKKFDDMRSRELLANWLVCATLNFIEQRDKFTFTSDPTGGDGIIIDTDMDRSWPTEHVYVPPRREGVSDSIEELVLKAINLKQNKGGHAYASGKTLLVFLDVGGGEWFPNRIARQLPVQLDFTEIWVTGLNAVEQGEYIYSVTCLDLSEGNSPAYLIRITNDFDGWIIQRVQ